MVTGSSKGKCFINKLRFWAHSSERVNDGLLGCDDAIISYLVTNVLVTTYKTTWYHKPGHLYINKCLQPLTVTGMYSPNRIRIELSFLAAFKAWHLNQSQFTVTFLIQKAQHSNTLLASLPSFPIPHVTSSTTQLDRKHFLSEGGFYGLRLGRYCKLSGQRRHRFSTDFLDTFLFPHVRQYEYVEHQAPFRFGTNIKLQIISVCH